MTETQQSDGPPEPLDKGKKNNKKTMASQAATYLGARMFGATNEGPAATAYLMKNLGTVVDMNQIALLDLGHRIMRTCANAIEKKATPASAKSSMVKSVAVLMETMQRACDALRDNKPNPLENPSKPLAQAVAEAAPNPTNFLPPLAARPKLVEMNGDREL